MDSKKHPPAPHDGVAREKRNGHGRGNGNGSNGNGSSGVGTGEHRSDSEITALIKAALAALPDLIALRVGVDTQDGVVTLTRSVESRTQTEIAVAIAAKMVGVKYVNDHLIATPRRRKADIRMPGSAGLLHDDGANDG